MVITCCFSSYRGTGFWVLIFLFPVAAHSLQEGGPLSGCASFVGGTVCLQKSPVNHCDWVYAAGFHVCSRLCKCICTNIMFASFWGGLGNVDWVALPKLSPVDVLCHSGFGETEDHG